MKWLYFMFLVALTAGTFHAQAERVVKDNLQPERAQNTQLAQPDRILGQRPLVTRQLQTGGITAAERVALKPKYPVVKPAKTSFREGLRPNVLVVKFVDGARIREEGSNTERSAKTDSSTLFSRLDALKPRQQELDSYDKELLKRKGLTSKQVRRQMHEFRRIMKNPRLKNWHRVFRIDEGLLENFRLNAEIVNRQQSADLANYYVFELQDGSRGERLADRLNELDIVEIAYLAPIAEDADIPPVTADFETSQGYLDSAPNGIDAKYAWNRRGGKGAQVKIIDIEAGWNLNHEDLPSMFINDGRFDNDDSRQHGTAVMGVMLGLQNGIGVTGIVPEASGGVVSVRRGLGVAYFDNVAEAVLIAAINLSEGDVILIEQHARGPGKKSDCTACDDERDQCGYIAMEYWNDIFDAINAASASGLIVVEAAGNGEMNLDHARYKDRFNRSVRDSGALMVGAGLSSSREPICWSNHGSRLDLQGWGDNVMTTGYGEDWIRVGGDFACEASDTVRANRTDDNQWYTTCFGGTSGATPIVAGAVAAIQGTQIANNNPVLNWHEMRDLLVNTGTAQGAGVNIGPLPDLRAALDNQAVEQPPTPKDAEYTYEITLDAELLDADRTVSGFNGERTRILGTAAEAGAIERLKLGERSDRPCFAQAEKADIVSNQIIKPHADLDICGNKGPTDNSLKYLPLLTTSHDTFIRGVSVCNSKTSNNTRLKGVKVYRTAISPEDGSFDHISNPTTMERPNCDGNWRTPAMCPEGSVATKLVVHISDEGNNEIITGLSLRCKEVKVTKKCVANCRQFKPMDADINKAGSQPFP